MSVIVRVCYLIGWQSHNLTAVPHHHQQLTTNSHLNVLSKAASLTLTRIIHICRGVEDSKVCCDVFGNGCLSEQVWDLREWCEEDGQWSVTVDGVQGRAIERCQGWNMYIRLEGERERHK